MLTIKASATKNKRKLYTATEKQSLVKQFVRSRLSVTKFCQINVISESAIRKWSKEFSDITTSKSLPQAFIPVQTANDNNQKWNDNRQCIILQLPNNMTLRIPNTISASYIAQVIQGLTG